MEGVYVVVAPISPVNEADSASGPSSIAKAARLLRALALAQGGEAGVTELALASGGMPKSTVHRVLAELSQEGMVAHCGSRYRLGTGWHALQLTNNASEWSDLLYAARYPLEEAFEATGASVHLAVLESSEVLYLEKLTGRGGTRVPTRVGARMPATCTALGKALLAHSDTAVIRSVLSQKLPRQSVRSIVLPRLLLDQLVEIRTQGVAYDYEEAQSGMFCVAAPVLRAGRSVAAVSLTRLGSAQMATDRGYAMRAARRITEVLETPY
jgi:DNA-binding IclR family transcriptional regulator